MCFAGSFGRKIHQSLLNKLSESIMLSDSFTSQVYVSSSLANLYEGVRKKDWRLVYTGIPVLLHDKGSARSRSSPRVTFVLAERGSA